MILSTLVISQLHFEICVQDVMDTLYDQCLHIDNYN